MRLLLKMCFLLLPIVGWTQTTHYPDLDRLQPNETFENVHVQKVYSDSAVSTFVIWVRKNVPPHYHEYHTEQVYVLEGEGIMKINGEEKVIKPGDYMIIPAGAVHSVTVTSEAAMKVLSIQAPEFTGKDRVWVED